MIKAAHCQHEMLCGDGQPLPWAADAVLLGLCSYPPVFPDGKFPA